MRYLLACQPCIGLPATCKQVSSCLPLRGKGDRLRWMRCFLDNLFFFHYSTPFPLPPHPSTELTPFLEQSKDNFALGHRKRGAYAFAHLVPKKRYQRFLPCKAGSGNSSPQGEGKITRNRIPVSLNAVKNLKKRGSQKRFFIPLTLHSE